MTEQEAKTKWCPMARVSTYTEDNPAESAANKTDEGIPYSGSRCIASDCMMWRKMEKCHSPLGRCFGGKCLECNQYKTSGFCGFGGTP